MSKEYPHWILRLVAEAPKLVILDSDEMTDYEWDSLLPSLVFRMDGTVFLAVPGGKVECLTKEQAKEALRKIVGDTA